MEIRLATPEDAKFVADIRVSTYQTSYRGYLPDDFLDSLKIDDDIIKMTEEYLKDGMMYLAIEDNRPVANAHITDKESGIFDIDALYCHPKYQKRGAGRLLVETLCKMKKEQGFKYCTISTLKNGPSVAFYERVGFKKLDVPDGKWSMRGWDFSCPTIKMQREL